MKKPPDFPLSAWIKLVQQSIEEKIEIPKHWMTRQQFADKFGYKLGHSGRIVRKLVEKGLLKRHLLKRIAYYEPVITEKPKN